MAGLGQIPSWLDVTPQSYIGALEAGSRVGLQLGAMRQRQEEAQSAREDAAQRMALSQAIQQQRLEQAVQFHQQSLAQEQASLAQKDRLDAASLQEKTRNDLAINAIQQARNQLAEAKTKTGDEVMKHRLDIQDNALKIRQDQIDQSNAIRDRALDIREKHYKALESKPGSLSAVDKQRIKDLDIESKKISDRLPENPPAPGVIFSHQGAIDSYNQSADRLKTLRAQKEAILSGSQPPTTGSLPGPGSEGATGLRALPLTKEKALEFLKQAGGDKAKARQLATDAGFSF